MAREKKDGKKVSFYFDAELYEQLKAYAEEKGQPVTTALERIVRKALAYDISEKKEEHASEL